MQKKNNDRAFSIYLLGQGALFLGESFRLIAVTMLIFKLTGSGLGAAFGLAVSSLPSIIASPFAGVLGDRIEERRVLVLIDLARFVAVPLFLYVDNVFHIYLLIILLSFSDIFYAPSKKKFILRLTGRKGALKANSLLSGMSGAAYLSGPLAAGVLTDKHGPAPAIIIASLCCLVSGVLTLLAGNNTSCSIVSASYNNSRSDFIEGLKYCIFTPTIRALMMIGVVTGFCTISVNMAFYPFAFDVLKVTAKGWSLLITIYYGTNFVAMLLVKYIDKNYRGWMEYLYYFGFAIVAIIWAQYTYVTGFASVLLLQFIEGSVIGGCGILLATRFQIITQSGFIARTSSMNEIFTNAGKLMGLIIAAVLTNRFSFSFVFAFNSVILFVFAFWEIIFLKEKNHRHKK